MSNDAQHTPEEVAAGIPGLTDDERKKAAIAIQAIRDAQFRELTAPHGPNDTSAHDASLTSDPDGTRPTNSHAEGQNDSSSGTEKQIPSPARRQWQRVGQIALRAGADDPDTDSESDFELDTSNKTDQHLSPGGQPISEDQDEKIARRQRKAQARNNNKKVAKMMDLQYFLEMVDHKHRYGSNLRTYHSYWKSQPISQNFFYWLDYGEGRDLDLPQRRRERLDREQVRYLSREERMYYLVKIDKEGRLTWAKNGERISTKDDAYRDSIHGIVPLDSTEPRFRENNAEGGMQTQSSSSDDTSDEAEESEAEHYADDFQRAKGPSKLAHVSPAIIFNHLIRTSIKRGNKWIFVADTAFRLYIGIKESGAFQHSSFLHGARISSAGLIKVKDGQLRSLSPLSGHYRPPAANFRAFVHNLRDEGVDMSRVSISKSYAVLVGIEGYTKTRKRIKKAEQDLKQTAGKIVHPEKAKEEEEKNRDKSKSAEKERLWLESQRVGAQRKEEEDKRKRRESLSAKVKQKLRIGEHGNSVSSETMDNNVGDRPSRSSEDQLPSPNPVPGPGPEEGVPPPEGVR